MGINAKLGLLMGARIGNVEGETGQRAMPRYEALT
jgi:hypothetical protein